MVLLRSSSVAVVLVLSAALSAQSFVNGNLEGAVGSVTSIIPNGWQAVPFMDPVCLATADYGATPDLTDAFGPVYDNGIMGNPRSGQSFVTGLHGFGSHHEGLKQTVSGFSIGCTYIIGLYQTVCKQINSDAMDPTGSWSVYTENTLIGVTATTTSNEPAVSLNKPWERRELTFTATATTHVIKFMPTDDDGDQLMPNGVRMGIDSVWIEAVTGATSSPFLGPDQSFCAGITVLLETGLSTAALWQDGSIGTSYLVTGSGLYWAEVSTSCGTMRDTVIVTETFIAPMDLGADTLMCFGEELLLDASSPNAQYLWQDGTEGSTFLADEPGTYWVETTTSGCITSDTITVEFVICDPPPPTSVTPTVLQIPNVFSPNGSGLNDQFTPVRREGVRAMRTTIFNRWGNEVFNTNNLDIGWNGKAINGEPVPEGTYFWLIDYTEEGGEPGTLKGSLTLLR